MRSDLVSPLPESQPHGGFFAWQLLGNYGCTGSGRAGLPGRHPTASGRDEGSVYARGVRTAGRVPHPASGRAAEPGTTEFEGDRATPVGHSETERAGPVVAIPE